MAGQGGIVVVKLSKENLELTFIFVVVDPCYAGSYWFK